MYIGELPPPYGGVTVKNELMLKYIFNDCNTRMIDLMESKRAPWKTPLIFSKMVWSMVCGSAVVIGVGSAGRRRFLLLLQKVLTRRRGLKKVAMIVMGGVFHETVAQNVHLQNLLKDVGSVWVESEQMINAFKEMGITQTYLFPNCRTENGAMEPVQHAQEEPLKLVFFSRICIEKGVEVIIAAYDILAEKASDITLDFYGELEDDIKEDFLRFVEMHENVRYHGVFDSVKGDVYAELNQYDVMLNISKREGVAGTLVESKMAGISAIVSDNGFNCETVQDDIEGVVIGKPNVENLAEAIKELIYDRDKVWELKRGAYRSRKRYSIDTYRHKLLDSIFR